ncbi:MAG: hypothetical protein ACLFR2_07045 [Candidatus Kapaibacterium sp.]
MWKGLLFAFAPDRPVLVLRGTLAQNAAEIIGMTFLHELSYYISFAVIKSRFNIIVSSVPNLAASQIKSS